MLLASVYLFAKKKLSISTKRDEIGDAPVIASLIMISVVSFVSGIGILVSNITLFLKVVYRSKSIHFRKHLFNEPKRSDKENKRKSVQV